MILLCKVWLDMPNNGALNSASITLYDIFLNMPLYDDRDHKMYADY